MSSWKAALAAFSIEGGALALLFVAGPGERILALYLVPHALACALAAAAAIAVLPARYRSPRLPAFGFIFAFAFFVPVIGIAAIAIGALAAALLPAKKADIEFAQFTIPAYNQEEKSAARQAPAQGALRARLFNFGGATEARLKALYSLQTMPARLTISMLRATLKDPDEDMRLIAYGMLDQREKAITARVHAELGALQRAGDPAARGASLRRLAELYWEYVYQRVAEGEFRHHAIAQSLRNVEAAIGEGVRDAGLLSLLGRLRLELGDLEAAERAFEDAAALGLPASRTYPFLAEIAFRRRDYRAVEACLAKIATGERPPELDALIRFWRPA